MNEKEELSENYRKKYLNALEWARKIVNGEIEFSCKEVEEEIFPELIENGGVMIKKELIQYIKRLTEIGYLLTEYSTEWISWLEKKKDPVYNEQCKESEDESIGKELYIYLDWLDGRKDYAPKGKYTIRDMIAWLEKQNGQKATTVWHDVSEVPDEMQEILVEWESPDATWHNIAFYDAETKAFRYLKQPISNVTRWAYVNDILTQSATKISDKGWSEEDEENLQNCLGAIGAADYYTWEDKQEMEAWLTSLKTRLNGQRT